MLAHIPLATVPRNTGRHKRRRGWRADNLMRVAASGEKPRDPNGDEHARHFRVNWQAVFQYRLAIVRYAAGGSISIAHELALRSSKTHTHAHYRSACTHAHMWSAAVLGLPRVRQSAAGG